jgi:hypothetical protein
MLKEPEAADRQISVLFTICYIQFTKIYLLHFSGGAILSQTKLTKASIRGKR